MGQTTFMLPLALGLLVAGSNCLPAQQPGGNLFDGEWTLTFDVATPPGGVTIRGMYGDSNSPYHMAFQASKRLFRVKADGTATATPTPPGAPQPYERSLQIDLDWSGGNGAYAGSGGGSGAYIVDAEGEQLTVTGPTTTTIPVTYWQAKWTLKPARTKREEISAEEIRETTTYEGSHPAEVSTVLGKYKVTERIEVKHVRNLKLVPRG